MPADSPRPLNPRQQRFVELVAGGMPAGRAYEAAGFKARGKGADECACQLLKKTQVAKVLAEIRRQQSKDGFLTREDIRKKRWEMVNDPKVGELTKARLLADEAKMMGYDEPEKSEDKLVIEFVKNW